MHGIAKLLGWRGIRIVRSQVGIAGFVAVGAPMSFIFSAVCVVNNDSMISVAVGDVRFVFLLVDEDLGWTPQVLGIVTAFTLPRLADLHQKLSGLRELQDHRVI